MSRRYTAAALIAAVSSLSVIFNLLPPLSVFDFKSCTPGKRFKEEQWIEFSVLCVFVIAATPIVIYWMRKSVGKSGDFLVSSMWAYFAFSVTNLVVNFLKFLVGKERPDYGHRIVVHKAGHFFHEGRRSFPSGHTALALSSAIFIAREAIVSGRMMKTSVKKGVFIVLGTLLPSAVAFFVSVSRISDNRHDIIDVLAGGSISVFVCLSVLTAKHMAKKYEKHAERSRMEELYSTDYRRGGFEVGM